MTPQINGDSVQLNINPSGLSNGTHTATLTISAVGNPDVPSVAVPITLVVVDQVTTIYLPLVRR